MKKVFLAGVIIVLCATVRVHASATLGTIDPNNEGKYTAQLATDPGFGVGSDEINIGKFTTQSAYNITISDAGFRGFAWGSTTGWMVTNCLDTQSGCSSTNGNFKISVASNGTLSGYAWGNTAGWINFGPFTNSGTPQVKILSTGVFAGTTGNAGYAWSQNFGWITFDCTNASSCVVTDYIPSDDRSVTHQCSDTIDNDGDGLIDYPSDPGCTSSIDDDESNTTGGGGGGNPYQCSDTIDNDGDGLIDYPSDPGCDSTTDNDETDTTVPPKTYQCSDTIDNDGDGLIDYPSDPGCTSATDNNEVNSIVIGVTVYPPDNPVPPDVPNPPENPITPPENPTSPTILTPIQPSTPPPDAALRYQTPSAVVSIGALAIAVGIGSLSALLNAPFVFLDLWGLLLALLGLKRKHWGVVYDSKTKQPIDPAYVQLFDTSGKEIASCITDIEGRYGFLVNPGTYTISVHKTHYAFPSRHLAGRTRDAVYENLYFGEPISITSKDQTILKNIPMDPVAIDWNEVEKRNRGLLGFYARHEEFFRVLSNALYVLGFLYSLYTYILSPIIFNLIVIIIYIVVFILEHFNILKPKTANVVDARNDPLAFAKVDIYNAHLNQKVATKIASAHGRFLGIVPKGNYYVKVAKRQSLETEDYIPLATDAVVLDAHTGYITKRIKTGAELAPQQPSTPPVPPTPVPPTIPSEPLVPEAPQTPPDLPI